MAVQGTGAVLCWGENGHGELGLGHREPELFPQAQKHGHARPKLLAMGRHHSVAVTEEDEVLWSGLVGSARLDPVKKVPFVTPTLIPTVQAVFSSRVARLVACGESFTLFCLADGDFYGMGANGSGQLGLGHMEQRRAVENEPQRCDALSSSDIPVMRLVCGAHHTKLPLF